MRTMTDAQNPGFAFESTGAEGQKWWPQAGRKKDKTNLRMLPPGTYSDYLNLLKTRHPDRRISLKLFLQRCVAIEASFVHLICTEPSS